METSSNQIHSSRTKSLLAVILTISSILGFSIQTTFAQTSLISASFDTNSDGFVYADDQFNGTGNPAYASGSYVSSSGFSGGGLSVNVGGVDNSTVVGMSGGWSAGFSLSASDTVTITLRYRLQVAGTYEGDECGQALVAVDGTAVGPGGASMLAEFCGADPQTNVDMDSGWQQVSVDVALSAGSHTLTVGAYNNKKTRANESSQVLFDDIQVDGPCQPPAITITEPKNNHIQTSADIYVAAEACLDSTVHSGWGVRFKLDGGTGSGGVQFDDFSAPFEGTFTGASTAEHTISAILLDNTGTEVSGSSTQDEVSQIAVGFIHVAFGDSITFGKNDDISADDMSSDGRNTGGGYEPVLNDLLTSSEGTPHSIINEGIPGEKASDGLNRIADSLLANPDAVKYLLLFGTNDSNGSLPVASGCGLNPGDSGYSNSYKDNMQQIIDAIVSAGKGPIPANVPITLGPCSTCAPFSDPTTAPRNLLIQDYNVVINGGTCSDGPSDPGLLTTNSISETPPDFYNYFEAHQDQFSDNLHPDGIGYQSMADLWSSVLTGY